MIAKRFSFFAVVVCVTASLLAQTETELTAQAKKNGRAIAEQAVDMTDRLVNPSFEFGTTGWTLDKQVSGWKGADTIHFEGESLCDQSETDVVKNAIASSKSIHKDSLIYNYISGGAVGVITPSEEKYKPVLNFYIDNILSGYHKISIVLLPPHLINPADTFFIKPNKFDAKLYFADGTNSGRLAIRGLEDREAHPSIQIIKTPKDTAFVSNVNKIDTIVLAECIEIPSTCDAHGYSYGVQLELTTKITFGAYNAAAGRFENRGNKNQGRWKYDNSYRVDQVIFEPIGRPATDGSSFANIVYEQITSLDLYQTIHGLPAGIYSVEGCLRNTDGTHSLSDQHIYAQVGDVTYASEPLTTVSGIYNSDWTRLTVTNIEVGESDALQLGACSTGDGYSTKGWFQADDFRLYYWGKKQNPDDGIEQLTTDKSQLIIYDLMGRRMEKIGNGIYIVNGKKVVFK